MVEGLSVAFHAVEMTSSLKLNDSVLVLGTGTIGLLIIQTLRLRGCGNIIAVDLDEGKLQMARRIGADYTFLPETGRSPDRVLV